MNITPETERYIIYRRTDMYGYQGWPSVARMDDGTLAVSFSGFRMQHVCPFGKTVMNISPDDGKTWSPPMIVNDTPMDDRDSGIVNLGGKRMLVTWFSHPAEVMENDYYEGMTGGLTEYANIIKAQIASYKLLTPEQRKGGSFLKISENGGYTWSETIRVPVSAPHGPSVMRDGSLLYLGKEHYSYGVQLPNSIAAYRSDDGYKWEHLSDIEIPEGCSVHNFHEPHVVELPNGRLLGMIRAQNSPVYHGFTMYSCFSDDKGKSWTTPTSLDVSGSPPHLLVHSSGAIICVFGRREPQFGEYAIVSYDNGETWTDEYCIDGNADCGDLGYPASVELPDGSIYTVYYQRYGDDKKTSILGTRWKLKG